MMTAIYPSHFVWRITRTFYCWVNMNKFLKSLVCGLRFLFAAFRSSVGYNVYFEWKDKCCRRRFSGKAMFFFSVYIVSFLASVLVTSETELQSFGRHVLAIVIIQQHDSENASFKCVRHALVTLFPNVQTNRRWNSNSLILRFIINNCELEKCS